MAYPNNVPNDEMNALADQMLNLFTPIFERCIDGINKDFGVDVSLEQLQTYAKIPLPRKFATTPVSASRTSSVSPGAATPGGCIFTITRGDRKGDPCGKTAKYSGYCKAHFDKVQKGSTKGSTKMAGPPLLMGNTPMNGGFPMPTLQMPNIPAPAQPGLPIPTQMSLPAVPSGLPPVPSLPGAVQPPLPVAAPQFNNETGSSGSSSPVSLGLPPNPVGLDVSNPGMIQSSMTLPALPVQ